MATGLGHSMTPSLSALRGERTAIAFGLLWGGGLLALLAVWLKVRDLNISTLLMWLNLLIALGLAGLAIWQVLPIRGGAADEQQRSSIAQERNTLSLIVLIGSVIVLAQAIWVGTQYGLASFGETVGMIVLAAAGFGCAVWMRRERRGTSFQENLLMGMLRIRQTLALALLMIGGALVIVVLWQFFAAGRTVTLVNFATACMAVVFLVTGLWQLATPPEGATTHTMRTLLLLVGGLTGFIIAVVTILQARNWWDLYFAGGVQKWHDEGSWRIWLCAYVELLALGLMFGSVLLAKTDIRSSAPLRRLLYGYNAVLNGLLTLTILIVVNIVIYVSYPWTFSWSQTLGLHTLSGKSKALLDNLKDPVTIYVLLPEHSRIYGDVVTLLDNCQAYSSRITVERISPDREPTRFRRLAHKYPVILGGEAKRMPFQQPDEEDFGRGILIEVGAETAGTDKLPHAFVSQANLSEQKHDFSGDKTGGRMVYVFKGEDVIMTQLRMLANRELKPKIYFTQGYGELDMTSQLPVPIDPTDQRLNAPSGMGRLVERLRKDNYEAVGLYWGSAPKRALKDPDKVFSKKAPEAPHVIPDDAKIVVLASPAVAYPKEVNEALEKYLDRNGKLIVLSGPTILLDGRIVDTKLSDLLDKYNVQLGKGFLVRYVERGEGMPWLVQAVTPTDARNELARSFRTKRFAMEFARKVAPLSEGKGIYHVEKLLQVQSIPNGKFWEETTTAVLRNPLAFLTSVAGKVDQLASPEPISVGVAVSDREQRARMVVLGDSAFADNQFIQKEPHFYDFLTSSIEWLVERPGNIGISPRESKSFSIRTDDVHPSRMKYLPLGLLFLSFLGLATGVWIIRRR